MALPSPAPYARLPPWLCAHDHPRRKPVRANPPQGLHGERANETNRALARHKPKRVKSFLCEQASPHASRRMGRPTLLSPGSNPHR